MVNNKLISYFLISMMFGMIFAQTGLDISSPGPCHASKTYFCDDNTEKINTSCHVPCCQTTTIAIFKESQTFRLSSIPKLQKAWAYHQSYKDPDLPKDARPPIA